jgi:hypothetical protein
MTDFRALLTKPIKEIEEPQPLPPGTYTARIGQSKFGDTKGENATPFVEFPLSILTAGDDVDTEALENWGNREKLARTKQKITFYLTEDSLFRLANFIKNTCEISEDEADNLNDGIPLTLNKVISIHISHGVSKKTKKPYATVDDTAAIS